MSAQPEPDMLRHVESLLEKAHSPTKGAEPEPRWQAAIAILAVGAAYAALPHSLSVGPRWLLLVVVVALLVPTNIAYHVGRERLNRFLGFVLCGVLTIALLWSLVLLIVAVPQHKEQPVAMLRSAAALWASNILVFALWYWRLDGGGPHGRDKRPGHQTDAFLFPQMNMPEDERDPAWSPQFLDYLFLAFNTSTALSPTDTSVLDRWAKLLVMTQALISLTTVAILLGRAVNIM